MNPECSSTSFFETYNPRPDPPYESLLGFACENLAKSFLRSSSLRPLPLSLTPTTIQRWPGGAAGMGTLETRIAETEGGGASSNASSSTTMVRTLDSEVHCEQSSVNHCTAGEEQDADQP